MTNMVNTKIASTLKLMVLFVIVSVLAVGRFSTSAAEEWFSTSQADIFGLQRCNTGINACQLYWHEACHKCSRHRPNVKLTNYATLMNVPNMSIQEEADISSLIQQEVMEKYASYCWSLVDAWNHSATNSTPVTMVPSYHWHTGQTTDGNNQKVLHVDMENECRRSASPESSHGGRCAQGSETYTYKSNKMNQSETAERNLGNNSGSVKLSHEASHGKECFSEAKREDLEVKQIMAVGDNKDIGLISCLLNWSSYSLVTILCLISFIRKRMKTAPNETKSNSAVKDIETDEQRQKGNPGGAPAGPGIRPPCVMCRVRKCDTMLIPCSHLVTCSLCASRRSACPRCDSQIRATCNVIIK